MIKSFHYVYGPVQSWRLGRSLGVDPLSCQFKVCNMDCIYCQLGKTKDFIQERKDYVSVSDLISEIERVPLGFIDYITFSGRGEPTLARNLGEMICAIKAIRREKVAVITNSSLLYRKDVQDDLMTADFVLAKLDAVNQQMLNGIDGVCDVDYDQLIRGIGQFRERFKGKFALQIMLIKDNIEYLKQLGALAFLLNPHEVQLNTPIRPCDQEPLSRDTIQKAKKFFKNVDVISCYGVPSEKTLPFDEKATITRHGNYRQSRYIY